jgi:hypothetical protein
LAWNTRGFVEKDSFVILDDGDDDIIWYVVAKRDFLDAIGSHDASAVTAVVP